MIVTPTPEQRDRLRANALEVFDLAFFYKPRPDRASGEASELAPLIVQQVWADDERSTEHARLSSPSDIADCSHDESGVEDAPVYTGGASVQLGGRLYEQTVYVWRYARTDARADMAWQGIRITWGIDGFPLAWEVLGSGDGVQRLFVSSTLELAAAEMFGEPLPGRHFAIERSVADAPAAVVLRVVEDGPIPMGPYVYVEADTHEVATVICRCSPSQVNRFVETLYYCLQPLENLEGPGVGLSAVPDNLARCLRWPY